ncbi:uncharacterized protein TNCV_3773851 [Trichonephila clavipes]|nr:uncharacterized protein TNCV_3773851 [Trichonephila clavipes]
MQDHLWESCGSVVSPDDLCRSLICLHRLSGSSVFSSDREDLRCRRLMLVSWHLCDVITWWEQKLSALKIVVLSLKNRCGTGFDGEQAWFQCAVYQHSHRDFPYGQLVDPAY